VNRKSFKGTCNLNGITAGAVYLPLFPTGVFSCFLCRLVDGSLRNACELFT